MVCANEPDARGSFPFLPLWSVQSAQIQPYDNTHWANEVCPCTSQFICTNIVLLTAETCKPT